MPSNTNQTPQGLTGSGFKASLTLINSGRQRASEVLSQITDPASTSVWEISKDLLASVSGLERNRIDPNLPTDPTAGFSGYAAVEHIYFHGRSFDNDRHR